MFISNSDSKSIRTSLRALNKAHFVIKMGSQESKTFKSVQTTFEKGDFIEQVQNKYNLQPQKPTVVQEITDALKGKLSIINCLTDGSRNKNHGRKSASRCAKEG